jgi:hypothetical protein
MGTARWSFIASGPQKSVHVGKRGKKRKGLNAIFTFKILRWKSSPKFGTEISFNSTESARQIPTSSL